MQKIDLTVDVLKQLMDTSPAAMFIVDQERNMLFANKSYATMFGYEMHEVVNVNARIFHISDESYERFGKIAFESVKKGEPVSIDFPAKKKDGSTIWIHIVGSLVPDQDLILWTMFDITKRVTAEKKLEEINYNFTQYLNAIDKIEIGIFVVDEDYTVRYMNKTMQKWFGDQTEKVCYSSIANLDKPCPYCKLGEVIHENRKVVYEPVTPDGRSFDIVATSIKNSDGTVSKMEVIRNVTVEKEAQKKVKEQQEKLEYQAYYDSLTGLPNRRLFYDRLEQGIEKAKRNGEKMALLFIDLDRFKEINDSLGHDAGDEVLKIVAQRLRGVIRAEDSLSRLGGDEFTILMQNLKQGQDASVLAQKIFKALSEVMYVDDNELYVSCSIGISLYPDDGVLAQNLLKYADSAMYKAKAEGRSDFQFYSSDMTELAFERVVMESSLRAALKQGDFVIFYQPQINGINSKLIGMEALVRWNHENMGLVSPTKFIPLAEATGLIVALDRFVMRTAMQQIAQWYKAGLNPGRVALNLSVKQLQQDDFVSFVESCMSEFSCKPEWIEIEVTESQIMKNPKEAIDILNKVSSLGVELAIDDFGTGYSSLAYLKKLPIDKLKIDQSFVRDLPNDEEDVSITKAVIALGKSLNLKLIAEGVEYEDQKDFLIENGCENIQGYFYSKPLNTQEMEIFLKDDIISKN
jgi:diguanylate cyclase (GGDEF)-like protein/PAS domain S-box-containing protein